MYSITNPLDFLSLLGSDVFYGCQSLNNIIFESTKAKTIMLSNNVTQLGESVFENCQSVEDAYIEMDYNIIPKNTFRNCINLSQIYFKDNTNITTIDESSFENCSNLTVLDLPINLQNIGVNSFKGCSKLEQIMLYNNININSTSFSNCQQLTQTNNAVIFTDNSSVKNYFTTFFPNVKQLNISSLNTFEKYFKQIGALFNYERSLTKTFFYPSFDVKLTSSKQIINTELISNLIDINIQSQFRNLILKFIFEINSNYNSFVINNQKLKLNITPLGLSSSYFVTIYNSLSRNIDTANDIKTNNYLAIYGLLENNYSEALLNNYKVRLYVSNNKYNLEYSTDNFVSSTPLLINGNSNTTANITNYNILSGDYNDFIIYRDVYSTSISLYVEALSLNITTTAAEILSGQTTQPMTADAYTSLNVPLSVIINTFMYWSDAINVDEVIPDGVKFKVVNNPEWQNIYLARAITSSSNGGIPYYKPSSIMAKNEIKYDFVRYIALKLFKTSAGADIFRNNDQVTNSIENNTQTALLNKLSELENLGEFTNEDSINNVSRIIFRQIVQQQPSRIIPNEGTWTPMNLYAGDKLYLKLTINTDSNQHKLLNPNSTTPIPSRSYLIELNLVSG